MKRSFISAISGAALLVVLLPATDSSAQSLPTQQQIIDALLGGGDVGRGVTVEEDEGAVVVPSIDLKVNFAFNSARLDNDSILTLDRLGGALQDDALKGQLIEIVGHTDASGSMEYNDDLSERRADAVVSYLVQNFDLNPALISSRGMGERQLLAVNDPEAGINRRVEIRNVTHGY